MKKYLLFAFIISISLLFASCRKEQVSRMYVRDVDVPGTIYLGDTATINFKGYFPADCWQFDRFDSKEDYLKIEVYPYMRRIDSYCPIDSIPFERSAKFFPKYEGDWAIITYGADTTIVKHLYVQANF